MNLLTICYLSIYIISKLNKNLLNHRTNCKSLYNITKYNETNIFSYPNKYHKSLMLLNTKGQKVFPYLRLLTAIAEIQTSKQIPYQPC